MIAILREGGVNDSNTEGWVNDRNTEGGRHSLEGGQLYFKAESPLNIFCP